jgi:hypothetical protein
MQLSCSPYVLHVSSISLSFVSVLHSHDSAVHKTNLLCSDIVYSTYVDWPSLSGKNAASSFKICNIRVQSCAADGGNMFLQNVGVICINVRYNAQEITIWIILALKIRKTRMAKLCVNTRNGNFTLITTIVSIWIVHRLYNNILKLHSIDYMVSCKIVSN